MLTLTQTDIPSELLRLPQPPKKLFTHGASLEQLMSRPRIAIVGSRKVTPYGKAVTAKLASELAARGVVIISGLALGVDSVAHASCLDAGGSTIAVLPSGLDKIYPTTHTNLAKRIVEQGGTLVTEYPANSVPYPTNFLERNRLVAALSEGVLITEAAARSGSLNTANHALELGLPVLVVPGNITSPLSEGCNNLIKAGAVPVTNVDDIIRALNWQFDSQEKSEVRANNEAERIVLDLLQEGVTDGHELLIRSQLETAAFNQTLTMLEITGRIRPIGANHWAGA